MYNNTFTSSDNIYISSSIIQEEIFSTKKSTKKSKFDERIYDLSYLYSIELNRVDIKNDLSEYYDFETAENELDFLASHTKIKNLLPGIAKYIKNYFDSNSKLVLELMSESKNWQTLFINIHTQMNWEKSNEFIDEILQNLIDSDSEITQNLNLNIMPDEF